MSLTWQQYNANVPRFAGTDRALLLGPGGTNLATNPPAENAAIGTPGTLPSGFSVDPGVAGLSLVAVVSKGVFNGVSWTEYEFQTSAAGICGIIVTAATVTSGLDYRGQVFVAWPGAVPAIINPALSGLRMGNAATVFVQRDYPQNGLISTPTSAPWTANATGATDLQIRMTSTGAGTFRIRIGWVDLKQASFLTNPILAASGPAAIGADRLSATLATLGISGVGSSTWTFDVEYFAAALASGGNEILWQMDDGSASNRFSLDRQTGTGILLLRRVLGGSSATTGLGTPTPGVRTSISVSVRGDGTAAAVLHGNASASVSGGPTSGLTTVRFNGGATGANMSHVRTRRVQCLPYSVTDGELTTFAAAAAVW
jgi:hypothetical protein